MIKLVDLLNEIDIPKDKRMISLVQLLKEVQGNPKAIIMAGAAGAGKSTFVSGNTEKAIEGLIQKVSGNSVFERMSLRLTK